MLLLGVDVGGTFTDILLADSDARTFAVHKVPSSEPDPSVAMVEGIRELCRREGVEPSRVRHLFHGTTVATNAILEHEGATVGMLTTKGYRDVLHIGRHQRPQNYSIAQDIPWQSRPLARRRHRKVVTERLVPPAGEVLVPLDEEEARARARELRDEGVDAVAVCFLFSYLNPAHELRVREIVEEEIPGAFVTTSAEVSPRFREFERFTTACMNAFLGPRVRGFVSGLTDRLREAGVASDVHIMTSNGGVATARTVSEKPVYTLLSGPAAGILGGRWVAGLSGEERLITFDVGGTSADIGIVTPRGIAEASARDTQIAGYPVMVPMLDAHTIGAGGGSVAYVDAGGAFRVGPRSAGSTPGPACYGLGGEEPTVTDASLVLGRLDPDRFLGGAMPIDRERAERALAPLAKRLGLGPREAAEGVGAIVASNMANAIRSRTVQKGHDPRRFTLVAFGGAGPMTAVEVARHLKIPRVVIPLYPGLTSALGLLTTDLRYDFLKTEFVPYGSLDTTKLAADVEALEADARAQLSRDGIEPERIRLERSLDLRYLGQGYELTIPLAAGAVDGDALEAARRAFHERHRVEYGHAFPDNPVEIVNLRLAAVGEMPELPRPRWEAPAGTDPLLGEGETYFRVDGALRRVGSRLYERTAVAPGTAIEGPAILYQRDSTTVLPPGSSARADEHGNLIVETGA